MRLTQLFVRRPTLVTVMVTLIAVAGIFSYLTIVQQQFPNIEFPTVAVSASYPGASTSEIRDAVVRPIEDEIAGAANLDHINSTIQQGQAQISAVFSLSSSQTADLVQVQERVQAARATLPNDLPAPTVRTFNPGEPTVVTLAVTSNRLSSAELSALVTNNILPALEQVDGIATASASGAVTPAIEVAVHPDLLDASGLTIGDLVNTIAQDNVRAPGGIDYAPNRETSIDVRGDLSTPQNVAQLLINGNAQNQRNVSLGGGTLLTGPSGGISPSAASSSTTASRGATGGAASGGATSSGSGSGAATSANASSTDIAATNAAQTSPQSIASTTSINGPSAASVYATPAPAGGASAGGAGSVSAGTSAANAGTPGQQVQTGAGSAAAAPAAAFTPSAIATAAPIATAATQSTGGTAVGATTTTRGAVGAATPAPLPGAVATYAPALTPARATTTNVGATTTGGTFTANTASTGATGGGGFTPPQTQAAYAQSLIATQNPWSIAQRYQHVSDLATVTDGYEPQRVYSYVNGSHIISINVQKATGASEITASKSVLAALPSIERRFPQVTFRVLNVQADFTQTQLDGVFKTLGEAILFTGIVMLFFLRSWRNAIVVMIAIPTSLFMTLTVMKLAGFTIDTISLLAMTLLIGILVDDSIVVLENTERHHRDGEAPQTAAILGRQEIGLAAIVITLVDVVVFLPIAFLPGTVGKFLSEFGLVVTVATLTSLLTSFTVTPGLAGNWSLKSRWKPWWIIEVFGNGFERVRRFYVMHFLEWGLRHPWIVIGVSIVSTLAALALIPLHAIGFEFIPAVDRGEVFVQAKYPTGTPLATTDVGIHKLAQIIARNPDVQSSTAIAGGYQAGFGGSINLGSEGQVHVFLVPTPKHPTDYYARSFDRLAQRIMPGAQIVSIAATGTGGGNSQPLDYTVSVASGDATPYVARVEAAMRATPGTTSVTSSQESGAPQDDLVFDRDRARSLDVSIGAAANAVKAAFGGALATQFDTVNGTKYVQVLYPRSDQTGLPAVLAIPVRANNGSMVHIGDFASLVNDPQAPVMTRTNRVTVIHVSGNTTPGATLSIVQQAFMARVAALGLPTSVSVRPNAGGQQQNLADTMSGMGIALVLSFALVYLLMVALYDSYRLPFIIMFSVPVATVGALGGLAITHQSLSLFALIGTVLLVGLVSKNGILLVDFAHRRMEAGSSKIEAIRAAASERFRPIIMTTSSMIAGMLPIALALEPGSSVRAGLGVVVIGGLSSSLLLTLVLVPVAFVRFAPRPRVVRPPHEPASPPPLVSVAQRA